MLAPGGQPPSSLATTTSMSLHAAGSTVQTSAVTMPMNMCCEVSTITLHLVTLGSCSSTSLEHAARSRPLKCPSSENAPARWLRQYAHMDLYTFAMEVLASLLGLCQPTKYLGCAGRRTPYSIPSVPARSQATSIPHIRIPCTSEMDDSIIGT